MKRVFISVWILFAIFQILSPNLYSQRKNFLGWGCNNAHEVFSKTYMQSRYGELILPTDQIQQISIPRILPEECSNTSGTIESARWETVCAASHTTYFIGNDSKIYIRGEQTRLWFSVASPFPNSMPFLPNCVKNFVKIASLKNSVAVTTFAICDEGRLWSFGSNVSGCRGLNTAYDNLSASRNPSVVTDLNGNQIDSYPLTDLDLTYIGNPEETWIDVACGEDFVVAIKSDGTLWTWGKTDFSPTPANTPYSTRPVQVPLPASAVKIAVGFNHVLVLTNNNDVYSWGGNSDMQLGRSTAPYSFSNTPELVGSNYTDIKAGYWHSLALNSNGQLMAWGKNDRGQLGVGDNINRSTPVPVLEPFGQYIEFAAGESHTIAINSDHQLCGWGLNTDNNDHKHILGQPETVESCLNPIIIDDDTQWSEISVGAMHNFAWSFSNNNRFLESFGNGANGLLGDGQTNNKSYPNIADDNNEWISIAAGSEHALGIKSNGTLWGWGNNTYGQIGQNPASIQYSLRPIQIGQERRWVKAYCGKQFSIVMRDDGRLFSFGSNVAYQLGVGALPGQTYSYELKSISPTTTWKDVSVYCAGSHVLAIRSDNKLFGWGLNGCFCINSTSNQTIPTPIQIGNDNWEKVAAGHEFSIGIKTNRTVWGWGNNGSGQLGRGNRVSNPIQNPITVYENGQIITNWTNVFAGENCSYLTNQLDDTYTCGSNSYYKIAQPNSSAYYTLFTKAINLSRMKKISCGEGHCIGLSNSNLAYTWGNNNYWQLGTTNSVTSPFCLNTLDQGQQKRWYDVSAGHKYSLGLSRHTTMNPITYVGRKSSNESNDGLSEVLTVAPNPILSNEGHFALICAENDNATISLYNPTGSEIMNIFKGSITKGVNQFNFSTTGLSSGVYFIKVNSSKISLSEKIIIQK